jgi:phenylalanyl-tRNA synthetase alpha chain
MQTSDIQNLKQEIEQFNIDSASALEQFRMQYISKKGVIAGLFSTLKELPAEERKSAGALINELKDLAQEKFKIAAEALEEQKANAFDKPFDLSLESDDYIAGARHPISITREKIIDIFKCIGFEVADGPEIEDDWHNFSALNFPDNHPARDMQDTFFIQKNPDVLLRTHTSTVQVRVMKQKQPPIRAIMPGRVYRNEAISARAHCLFHQVEGLYVNTNVSFKDLKDTLYYFVKEMFGKDIKVRFRPSFFPFTEPSAEIDISCLICKGAGCNICKHSGWVEIGGAGMVHPNVLKHNNIDTEQYIGFAFGMGLERITMLKYQIKDLRVFTENDVRFLRQFVPLS